MTPLYHSTIEKIITFFGITRAYIGFLIGHRTLYDICNTFKITALIKLFNQVFKRYLCEGAFDIDSGISLDLNSIAALIGNINTSKFYTLLPLL